VVLQAVVEIALGSQQPVLAIQLDVWGDFSVAVALPEGGGWGGGGLRWVVCEGDLADGVGAAMALSSKFRVCAGHLPPPAATPTRHNLFHPARNHRNAACLAQNPNLSPVHAEVVDAVRRAKRDCAHF